MLSIGLIFNTCIYSMINFNDSTVCEAIYLLQYTLYLLPCSVPPYQNLLSGKNDHLRPLFPDSVKKIYAVNVYEHIIAIL